MANPDVPFDLVIRELINGAWFVWATLLVIWLSMYLYERFTDSKRIWNMMEKPRPGIFRIWYHHDGVRLAIALLIVFAGDMLRAGWVWAIIKIRNNFNDASTIANWWFIGILAVSLTAIGVLCCIRVLSSRKTDWIYAAIIGFLILIAAEAVI